eukprot:3259602-Ditylum_brightwellii.AAC.1
MAEYTAEYAAAGYNKDELDDEAQFNPSDNNDKDILEDNNNNNNEEEEEEEEERMSLSWMNDCP